MNSFIKSTISLKQHSLCTCKVICAVILSVITIARYMSTTAAEMWHFQVNSTPLSEYDAYFNICTESNVIPTYEDFLQSLPTWDVCTWKYHKCLRYLPARKLIFFFKDVLERLIIVYGSTGRRIFFLLFFKCTWKSHKCLW